MAVKIILALAALACITGPAAAGSTTHSIHPQTGIESWQLQEEGVEVVLMQISPDQARGFFLGRGFKREDVDYYAANCVFATIVTNHSQNPVAYRLADWTYVREGENVARKIRLKDDWLKEWIRRGVSQSSRIAFEWSQHPDEQLLEPGDWNQGMTTYQAPLGSRFDLTVKWKTGEKSRVQTLRDIRCAK